LRNAIELEGLRKVYSGGVLALNDISFKIKQNSAIGYLGPNGAGKTTTIKILTNVLKPTAGNALIFGFDIQKETMKALQLCGALLEVPEFYPYLSPRETMVYLGKIRGMSQQYLEQRIQDVMEEVEMEDWIDIKIGKFSTGMRQRTAIAQAMLHEPPLLILDEPTNGLDPIGMTKIRNLINKLKKERTIFLSSHLLNEVEQVCDNVILINKGEILAFDSLKDIKNKIGAKLIKIEFFKPLENHIAKQIENLNEVQGLKRGVDSALINYDGTNKSASNILESIIKDLNLKVVSYKPIENRLEDFYIDLIEKDSNKKFEGGKTDAK